MLGELLLNLDPTIWLIAIIGLTVKVLKFFLPSPAERRREAKADARAVKREAAADARAAKQEQKAAAKSSDSIKELELKVRLAEAEARKAEAEAKKNSYKKNSYKKDSYKKNSYKNSSRRTSRPAAPVMVYSEGEQAIVGAKTSAQRC